MFSSELKLIFNKSFTDFSLSNNNISNAALPRLKEVLDMNLLVEFWWVACLSVHELLKHDTILLRITFFCDFSG